MSQSQTETPHAADAARAETAGQPVAPRPRLWPLPVIVVLQWLAVLLPEWLAPATMIHFYLGFLAPIVAALAAATWWVLASRLPWRERWLGLGLFTAAGVATCLLAHSSFIAFFLLLYALPVTTTAMAVWLVATPFLRWPARRTGLVVVLLCAWGCFLLVRYEGVSGAFSAALPWRWSPTDEEWFLAERGGRLPSPLEGPATLQPGDWPAFRGPDRDGRLSGVRIATDWDQRPPRQLWRQRVGPGWSSFAVVGQRLYTQEQRGDKEVVVCYDAGSGAELWVHEDAVRFSEPMAGAGPRATPTFHDGRIYAQGATGKLNCLDAATGKVHWSRDVAADSGAAVPTWGFAASPLVRHGIVAVFAGAPGKSVIAYDAASGKPAWSAGDGQFSYCSLHPARIDGVDQFLLATDQGLSAFDPVKGVVLWQHAWPLEAGMARVVQPMPVGDGDFLLGTGFGFGTQRVKVRHSGGAWTTQEVWTSRAIKPYYNDLVVHKGHIYGFDHNLLTCVKLADGKSRWRERGYGNGQVLLLPDQDLLLVLSETGEVALVDASPDAYSERARFQAIEGKTWNHPVIAHGRLHVRNGKEAACYELTLEK